MTYSYTTLGLPPSIYALIKEKLAAAGHELHSCEGDAIDMNGIGIVSEDMERSKATQDAIVKIRDTPALLSLLYDMDLLPEQLVEGSFQWGLMMGIVWGYNNSESLVQLKENP